MKATRVARRLLLFSGLAAAGFGFFMQVTGDAPGIDETRYLEEIAPGGTFSGKGGTPLHYRSSSGSVAFNSHDVTPTIRGYNGPIKILLGLDPQGRIVGIRILEHVETKNYVHRLETPEFLGQFLGKHPGDPFEVDRDIDGISRATVTVRAVGETVRESSREVARKVLALSIPGHRGTGRRGSGGFVYGLLMLVAASGYLLTKPSPRWARLRDICLAACIPIVGIWLASPLSVLHVGNMLLNRFSSGVLWVLAVPGVLITMLIFGRMYCGWLCPFGALAEFIGRIPLRKWEFPPGVEHRWRDAKYLVLWVLIVLISFSGRPDLANVETYVTLFSSWNTVPAWILTVLMVVVNVRVPRFWCRYLCPVAALGGLLSRTVPGYPSIPSCPMGNTPNPPGSECIRCNRCRSAALGREGS